jgi:hypothetical protein
MEHSEAMEALIHKMSGPSAKVITFAEQKVACC